MTQRTVGQRKLTRLAIITAITLSCIVALQVFWLCTSWIQQRNRFKADVTSIVADVSTFESMNNIQVKDNGTGTSSLIVHFTNTNKSAKTKRQRVEISSDEDQGNSQFPVGTVFISTEKDDSLPITQGHIDTLMDSTKAKMAEQLAKRDIHAPFELAIFNDKGAIVKSTCDTLHFLRISLKPKPKPLLSNHNKARLTLQAAFPDANLYLLRRMAVILSVTILLIIICAWSFSYMLIQFFRQKKLADIRNDFMNNMTHELKTPIAASLVAMELAEGRKHAVTDAEKVEYISVAKSEMLRLTSLLDNILKMAAFDQKEIQVSKSTQPVYDMVYEAVNNMQTISRSAAADVQVVASDKSLSVYADKAQIVHALQNLLENAIKYNDKSTPRISFEVQKAAEGVYIIVADNGKGIPSAYLSRVFDKFFRVPAGDIHDVKGYGLGLSYVKAIAELHGGNISVSSEEREGTVFTLFLPFK